MEHVEGNPIDSYVEGLAVRQIIALFLKVCSAVSYLHRNLVIHRDLKPANILVTNEGEPKLLDFGIAKLVDLTAEATVTSLRMLTPDYASPEQVMGEPVTTASDIYSMGAVLYRLLTGARPRSFMEGESIGAIMRAFSADEIIRPSKRVPSLKGDLEMIVMRTLRKEPQSRYATVDQLADDLEDFLVTRPIRARQNDTWYRAGKFLRRYWLRAAAGLIFAVGLLVASLVANHQRAIAQEHFLQVRQLARQYIELYDDVAHLPGSVKVRERIVSTALDYLDKLSASAGNDASLLAEIGEAYEKVAQAQGGPGQPNIGHAQDALASFRKAVAFESRAAELDGRYRVPAVSFRTELTYVAMLNGHGLEARQNLEASAGLLKQLQQERPTDPELLTLAARVATNRGDLGWFENQHSDQVAFFKQAAQYYLAYLRLKPGSKATQKAFRAMVLWSDALREARRFDEALSVTHQAMPMVDSLLMQEPANSAYLRLKMESFAQEGEIYDIDSGRCIGKPEEAVAAFRRRLEIAEKLVALDPNNASGRLSAAIANYQLSWPLGSVDPVASLRCAREGVRMLEEDLRRTPHDRILRSRHARALRHVAYALARTGRLREAKRAVERAISSEAQLVAESPSDSMEQEQIELSRGFNERLTGYRHGR